MREALNQMQDSQLRIWPVTDKERFVGIVSRESLETLMRRKAGIGCGQTW